MKKLFILLLSIFIFGKCVYSQDFQNATIDKLMIESRFDFDNYYNLDNSDNQNGFNGKYINFNISGKISEKFSYRYRQRLLPNVGLKSFFDGTDLIFLNYQLSPRFSFTGGKQVVSIGGFEYDIAPIDYLIYSEFVGTINCYELGLAATYTDESGKNSISLQMTNSPYSGMRWDGSNFSQSASAIDNKFAYNLIWYGNFDFFSTIYSVNFMEYRNNKYINYLALGNKFTFDKFKIYVDFMNRTTSVNDFMKNYSILSRVDYKASKSINIFAKIGYDKNISQNPDSIAPTQYEDIFVTPGTESLIYGLGCEYYPLKNDKIRLHFLASIKENNGSLLRCSAGLTWKINFKK